MNTTDGYRQRLAAASWDWREGKFDRRRKRGVYLPRTLKKDRRMGRLEKRGARNQAAVEMRKELP